jgi:hypothetical protein
MRLLICPRCKQRFYDMTHGRCFACGYKGWGFYQAVKIKKSKKIGCFARKIIPLADKILIKSNHNLMLVR